MSRTRTERLVNLVICLLSTRRFLSATQIAQIVPGYEHNHHDAKAHDAFQRRFERDKTELRELGIPVETGTSSVFDGDVGYRIARRDYELPDIHLEPDEAAAVGLATQLWQTRGLASAASSALMKLRAAGVEVNPQSILGMEPIVSTDPSVEVVLTAVRARRAIRFDYRGERDDKPAERNLLPWGAVAWRGRWYVVGHDTDRGATRCFRLSRVMGSVGTVGKAHAYTPPDDIDLVSYVASIHPPAQRGQATVRVKPGAAAGLRRWATDVQPGEQGKWDVVQLSYSDPSTLVNRLVGYGSEVVVLAPDEVRQAVIEQLTSIAELSVTPR